MIENKHENKKSQEVKFSVTNSIKLDPQHPVPIQYGGYSFYTVSGYKGSKKYIPFLGKDDNLPQLLLEARLTSTTQNACITTIVQSTLGKGLMIVDNANPDKDFTIWMKRLNTNQQSLNDILKEALDGERTQGNHFIEVLKGEVNGKKFIKLYTHPMAYCRFLFPAEDQANPSLVFVSKLIAKKGYRMVDIKDGRTIPLYSDNELDKESCWVKNENGTFSTMIHLKNEVNGIDWYGLPASVSGLRYQVIEGTSAQYNIDNFENNMILGGMLVFKSSMTQEEAQAQAKEILMTHIGAGKTGRIAVISSEQGLADVDFKPFETHKDGSFIELDKRIQEKIIAANGWDSILAGMHEGKSTLGNGSGYVRSIYDVKEAMLLNPLRTKLIDKVLTPIQNIYADWLNKPEIKDYEFIFQSSMPFSFMGDIDPETFMTVDEARGLASLPKAEKDGDKFLGEIAKNNTKNVQSNKPA